MDKKGRKTTLETRDPRLPILTWVLKNCTGPELDYLASIARSAQYKILINIIDKFTNRNIREVFDYMTNEPRDLSDYRAAKRGEVAGLRAFLIICEKAGEEIQLRKKKK